MELSDTSVAVEMKVADGATALSHHCSIQISLSTRNDVLWAHCDPWLHNLSLLIAKSTDTRSNGLTVWVAVRRIHEVAGVRVIGVNEPTRC